MSCSRLLDTCLDKMGSCIDSIESCCRSGFKMCCASTSCDHCSGTVAAWKPFYQISEGTYVGHGFRTTLCQQCYQNTSIKIEYQTIPEYYLSLSKQCTGHTDIEFTRVSRQRCVGPCRYRKYTDLTNQFAKILVRHNQSLYQLSSSVNTMSWIANLHWQRATAKIENRKLSEYETEIFRILDQEPDLYIPDNFVKLENPRQQTVASQTSMNITTMAV
jgi:hypothetical protein